MDLIRAFLAIDPGEALRARFAALGHALGAHFPFPTLRWTQPQDYHLTLVFLGQVRLGEIVRVHDCVAQVAATLAPVRYRFDRVCAFPDPRAPRVIAALPSDPQPLKQWQAPLAALLADAGFAIERRAYRPHLSLARWKGRGSCAQEADFALDLGAEARAITLYQSRGGHYLPLFSERCAGGARRE
ncbi:MAG: RNA 2',3'-cyclic phosphodiesterase [Pseudomonadales bacterium]|nr:RNA 2',3'-cyclic phosphodiesterase [Pseudomonadales bacterium]